MRSFLIPIFSFLLSLTVSSVMGQGCIDYGGGSCCPTLTPIDEPISRIFADQPLYVQFVPLTAENLLLDNVCYTYFPTPEGSDTYLLYISRVYCDGSNEVQTFIIAEASVGIIRSASGQCSFTDIIFDQVQRTTVQGCGTRLVYRCLLSGSCSYLFTEVTEVPVLGLSPVRHPIGRACLNKAKELIKANGLPAQEYHILPMRLPSQCVTQQVCVVQPSRQRFRQAVGFQAQSYPF